MIRAATATLILLAGQAQALSCARPDPATAFDRASASDIPYIVLSGELTAPPVAQMTAGQPASLLGEFTGQGLTEAGFTETFDAPVILQVTCTGPWCGSAPASGPVLAFARIDGASPVIELNACGSWLFAAPDQAMLDRLTACMQNGACSAQLVE